MTKYVSLVVAALMGVYLVAAAHGETRASDPLNLGHEATDSIYRSLDKATDAALNSYIITLVEGRYEDVKDLINGCKRAYSGEWDNLLICHYAQATYLSVDRDMPQASLAYRARLEERRRAFIYHMVRTEYGKTMLGVQQVKCKQGNTRACAAVTAMVTGNPPK